MNKKGLFLLILILSNANIALAKYKGHFKIGTPYEVLGETYYPKVEMNYDKEGIASWYGEEFHKKKTANGEVFKKHHISAAHPTLPLPSIVRVKNLENGKSIKVRVNDRGPFLKNRIIDLSKKAADRLGYLNKGTARVRVTFLKKDTEKLHKRLFGKKML